MSAPVVKSPCSLCEKPTTGLLCDLCNNTGAVITDPVHRRADAALHKLWSKSGGELYDKTEWMELDAAISLLARRRGT